jgi:hypothetical protein
MMASSCITLLHLMLAFVKPRLTAASQ